MENNSKFATYNPVINFAFYIGAIVFGMVFIHPIFLLCSVVLSSALLLSVNGRKAFKFIFGLMPLFAVISLVNPLFNTLGENILFTYFGRPYTLEALFYGMATASMLISVLLWFSSYNKIMTSDKFLYIFGKFMPSISLVFTMVLRFVPNYKRKAQQISAARKCVGKSGGEDNFKDKVMNAITVLSSLTSWALEGSIITADSMKSRGYGTGKRTNFSTYRFTGRDKILLSFMLVLTVIIAFCGINGAASVTYTPEFVLSDLTNPYTVLGVLSYILFLSLPTVLNITEEITWRILRSKI